MSVQEKGARPWPAAARSRLVVEIRLDPVPGWGNTPEDHRVLVQRLLEDAVGHYQPTVTIAPVAPVVEPLTVAQATELVQDGIAYWLGNPFMDADALAQKVCFWLDTVRKAGAS
jgi:hypothetical protein